MELINERRRNCAVSSRMPSNGDWLCEGRMRGSGRSALFHVRDSRLQIGNGKANAEIPGQHVVKRLTAADGATVRFTR